MPMQETVVLLHGFAGSGRAWDAVVQRLDRERYTPFAPDLRGHGAAAARRPAEIAACVTDVLALAEGPFVLCGYSMGARIALHVALADSERVKRLVLVSGTAGIEDAVERAERRAGDDALAARLEHSDIAAFAAEWMAQPLFAGTPADVAAAWRADLLGNEPKALAAALRGMGSGRMRPLWSRLGELHMPATVLVGERDQKFLELGERLSAELPAAELVLVAGAGHGLVREAPEAVARAIAAG